MDQLNLEEYRARLLEKMAERPKGIHSRNHELAKEICDHFGKIKEMGIWLSVAKRIGHDALKAKFEQMKSRGINNPRYLLAMTKQPKQIKLCLKPRKSKK